MLSLNAGRLKLGDVRLSERKTRICGGEKADELADPEATEEPGIPAGRNREGPWSRGRHRQGEKVAHTLPWQFHRDVLTAGPRDGSFPKFTFFFPFLRGFLINQQLLVSTP